jgi:hypothetical protein
MLTSGYAIDRSMRDSTTSQKMELTPKQSIPMKTYGWNTIGNIFERSCVTGNWPNIIIPCFIMSWPTIARDIEMNNKIILINLFPPFDLAS